jgi:hypothetical protein
MPLDDARAKKRIQALHCAWRKKYQTDLFHQNQSVVRETSP